MRNFTVLLATGALTGTLFLAGCQPPDEDDAKKGAEDEETVPHPPIEESRPGEETGAAAIDMESHRIAMVAEANGLPMIIVRAVLDDEVPLLDAAIQGLARTFGATDDSD